MTHKTRPLAEVAAEVDQIRGSDGNPIDAGIRSLVIGLRRFGIRTVMSCEGHHDANFFSFPYVDVDKRDIALLMDLLRRQNHLCVDGKSKEQNWWVILSYFIHEVRIIPHDLRRPLAQLQRDAEEFGHFLQTLEIPARAQA